MGYVDDHLLPTERIMHRTRLHKIAYLGPMLLALALMAGGVFALSAGQSLIAVAAFVLALIPLISAYIADTSSEFAVTDKRVIIKVGFIQRRTLETMLGKVEGIEVSQGILGRLLDFGSITVIGTGSTRELFANIARPLEFRRQVQTQIGALDQPGAPVAAIGEAREERECPFCAERILVKARICKHCGREV